MNKITAQELAEMRARCDAATPGLWFYLVSLSEEESSQQGGVNCDVVYDLDEVGVEEALIPASIIGDLEDHDACFIAHARTDLPRALDRIEELEAALITIIEHEESMGRGNSYVADIAHKVINEK